MGGKYFREETPTKKKRGKKAMLAAILAASVMLAVGGVVGGSFAWLTADTDPVVNTFTYGDIDLKLEETKLDEDGDPVDEDGDSIADRTEEGNSYKMSPEGEYLKDPVVTVEKGNEDCWLFVELKEEGGVTIQNKDGSVTEYTFDDYLEYKVITGDDKWIQLYDEEGEPIENVYYRFVEQNEYDDTGFKIIKDDKITVKEDVDAEMLNLLDNNGADAETATYPKLSITAYAVQYFSFEPEVENEGDEPTATQRNAAALKAWNAISEQKAKDFAAEAEKNQEEKKLAETQDEDTPVNPFAPVKDEEKTEE